MSVLSKGINREHEMHSSFYNFVIRNYVCHPVVSSSSLKMMEIKFLTFSNIFKIAMWVMGICWFCFYFSEPSQKVCFYIFNYWRQNPLNLFLWKIFIFKFFPVFYYENFQLENFIVNNHPNELSSGNRWGRNYSIKFIEEEIETQKDWETL